MLFTGFWFQKACGPVSWSSISLYMENRILHFVTTAFLHQALLPVKDVSQDVEEVDELLAPTVTAYVAEWVVYGVEAVAHAILV